jgi:hypothetical protein
MMSVDMPYLLGPVQILEIVDYSSLRDLRKQKPNLISRVSRIRGYEFRVNRIRLPELDQEAIQVPPFPRPYSCSGFLGADKGLIGYMNRDLSKMLMLGCDGLECHGDPSNPPRSGPKSYILEFCRFREVHRDWHQLAWKQK